MRDKSRSESRKQRHARIKASQARRLLLESLEARQLMAADLVYSTGQNNPLSDDLTLVAQNSGGNLSIQLLRTSTLAQVASVPLDDSGDVTVNIKREQTTAGEIDPFADTLRINLNSLSLLNAFVAANGGVLTINFEGGVQPPLIGEDHVLLASTGTANVGFGLSVITTADISLSDVNANFAGNLILRSNPNSSASGTALDLDKVLAFPAAAVTINGGSLSADNITVEAKATKTLLIGADSVMDGQVSFAEVIVNSSANISVQGSAILNATSNLVVWAESSITTDIGRVPTDDGDAGDDDTTADAAVAISIINGTSNVSIGTGSSLIAGGTANVVSNNLVSAQSDANGLLGSSGAGGITLAMTNISGDTLLEIDGGASISAVGNVGLIANTIRSATTLATATPQGASNDGDSSTTTRGETELASAGAGTSEGDVTFAAAIAIGNLSGNTFANLNNATVISSSGNVSHQAHAQHTVITKADGSSTADSDGGGSGDSQGTGIGVAVAIQHVNTDAQASIQGATNVDGNTILISSKMDGSSLTLDAISGPTGENSSSDVGFAGSVAMGVTVANARSLIADSASMNAGGANLVLQSSGVTTTTVRALPHLAASGQSVGVGASFALNVVDHTTEARVGDSATLAGVNNLTLNATSNNTKVTETKAGAAGGLAFAGAISILVSNDDTLASLGSGAAATSAAGNVSLTSDSNSVVDTQAHGDAAGGEDAGLGVALALSYDNQVTDALLDRNLNAGGNLSILATSAGKSDVKSTASAKGGKKESDSGGDGADERAADARSDADSRAQAGGARTSQTTQANPEAKNSDGSIAVAAAFAINLPEADTRATIANGRTITVGGQTLVRSLANHDAKTIADASATGNATGSSGGSSGGSDLGVGIAVALMSTKVNNVASIGSSTLTTTGLVLESGMRNVSGNQEHAFEATATSGAGAADNSIAGSFAAGVNVLKTLAQVSPMATINAGGGNVNVLATSTTSHKIHALPNTDTNGNSLGVGLSFALAAVDEVTDAGLVSSPLLSGATLIGANHVKIAAKSESNKDLQAKAGAAGDLALGGAVAILIDNEDTVARMGSGSGVTTISGNLEINADHQGSSIVKADGGAQGGSDAGIGAAVTLVYSNEITDAGVQRDLNVGGNLSILSKSIGSSAADAKASASGAQAKDGETTDSKSQDQRSAANASADSSGARNSSSTASNPSASTNSGGSIAVSAAVALNISEAESKAVLTANRNVTVGGTTLIRSQTDHDAQAIADSSATLQGGGDLAVGVAVGLVRSQLVNQALVGENTILNTKGLTLEATQPTSAARHAFQAQATSGAGGGDNGIAGSVAIEIVHSYTTATLGQGAQVTGLNAQPVVVRAVSNTTNIGDAKPNEDTPGSASFGAGGSFTLVRTEHFTNATIENSASLSSGASSLTVEALADHDTTAVAVNGAKNEQSDDSEGGESGGDSDGSLGIGAAVALALVKNTTAAKLGTAPDSFNVNGHVSVRAIHDHLLTTVGDGNADGGQTGIGVSFGLNQIDDRVSADLNRSLTLGGNLLVESYANVVSSVETKASASGASSDDKSSDSEANAQRNPSASNSGAADNTGANSTLPSASSESSQASSSSSSQSGSSSSGLGIAASLAFNIYEVENTATVGAGVQITAGGNARISANGHFDGTAKATGQSVTTEDSDAIAAGVGFSYADVDSLATVSAGAAIKATDVTVEALTIAPNDANAIHDWVVWGAAAGGGTGDYSVAGSVALNIVDLNLQARSMPGSSLKATNNLTVQSEIDLKPQTLAIAGAFSDGSAVGGALAFAEIDLNSTASIGGNADAANQMLLAAENSIDTTTTNVPEIDIDVDFTSVAVAGSAGTGSASVAAAVSVDDFSIVTNASIGANSLINQSADIVAASSQKITIQATSDTEITSLAGALGISTDGTGLGAGLQLEIVNKTTTATIGNGASVGAKAGVDVTALSDEKLINVAANGAFGDTGLAFSAAIYVVDSKTQANLGNGSSTTTAGNVQIQATGNFTATGVAGSVGAGSSTGVGASNVTLVHNDEVEAWVGTGATVDVDGTSGLKVMATSQEDIVGLALAGAASGSAAVAGSAMVSVMNETTSARIQNGAHIIANNGAAAGAPNVMVNASDTTNIVSVAGSLAASGGTAAGIGAEVSKLNKFTTAMIGSNVIADVEGDIEVRAYSIEDFTCVAAGLAIGGSNALAVDVAVTILDVSTRAFIGDDPLDAIPNLGPGNIHARGNIIVDADDTTEMDKVVGVIGVSGSATGAAGVTVSTIHKLTEAFIGENAKVTADGNQGTTSVKSGGFSVGHAGSALTTNGIEASSTNGNSDLATLKSQGEVGAPNVAPMKTNDDGKDGAVDGSNTAQRTVSPSTRSDFRGLSVTATNRDDIEVYNFALAAGGTAAVAISTGVSVVDNKTKAFIAPGANINSNLAGAHNKQSVNVTASSDYSQIVIDGALAVAGTAAIAPAVGVALVDLTTQASIAGSVNAKDDVTVLAEGQEDVLLVGVGIGGGTVGAGAAANVIDFKTKTGAAIAPQAVVQAGGDVLVQANDDSDVDVISGALGVGAVGLGAGVGVMMMTKETTAVIDSGAIVDAKGKDSGVVGIMTGDQTADGKGFVRTEVHGVVVQATSTDDYVHMAVVAGAGWVGVAGAVSISLIDCDTYATIGAGAKINQTNNNVGASNAQSVYVNAGNIVQGLSIAGAVAGGVVGVGGAVDFGTLNNDAFATVEAGAEVSAKNDVEVNALSIKNLEGFAISGAGGFIGVAGSVSVWSLGTKLDRDYSTTGTDQQDPSSENGSADADAANKAEVGQETGQDKLRSFQSQGSNQNTSNNRVAGATNDVATRYGNRAPSKDNILARLMDAATTEPGTTAKIAAGSKITAGKNIHVNAHEDTKFTSTVGSAAGGVGAMGIAVSINSVATNATARAGGTLSAGGDIKVTSNLDLDTNTLSFAGAGGVVALGAAVVNTNDRSVSQAYIDNGTNVTSASDVIVIAQDERAHKGETAQIAVGLASAGGSFVEVNLDNPELPETRASIGDGVTIGSANKPVKNVKLEAKPKLNVDVNTLGMSGGVGGATFNFAKSNLRPDTHALMGDATLHASGEVVIVAQPDIHAEVTGTGVAVGGVAIGAMLASLELGRGDNIDEVQAGVKNGAIINAKKVRIVADSKDYLDVQSVAGSGGVVSGSGASSSLKSDQSTLAAVGMGSSPLVTKITAETFTLKADHRQNIDSQADAATIGLIAGSWAELSNQVTGGSRVLIGDAEIEARNLTVNSRNKVDKDRYGSGNGVNLSTVSVSAGSTSVLASTTNIGTAAQPLSSKIQITPGSSLRAIGSASAPGYLAIDATTAYDTTDRVNAEEYSGLTGNTIAHGTLNVATATLIDVNGASIENKYGEIIMTTRTNGLNSAHADVTAASGLSALIDAQVAANADAIQRIDLNNAKLVGRDVRLFAGMDRNRGTNIINNTAAVQGFVASFFPSMVLPKATSLFNEHNTINVKGTTEIEAFGDIDLFTREGIGGLDRALATGKIFSLSMMPINVQASTIDLTKSYNDVNIDASTRLLAGASSTAIVQIVPTTFNGNAHQVGGQSVTLGAALSPAAKTALEIPQAMDYHYAPLNLGELTIDFYTGFVAKVVSGANGGGTVGRFYRFELPAPLGGVPLLLHQENFADTSRWTDLGVLDTPAQNAILQDGKAIYNSDALLVFKDQMQGRFAVVKPVEMENARLVYSNIGNMLYAQRAELIEWIKQHAGDIEALARYQAQLDDLNETMVELGLAEEMPLSNSTIALTYKQNLDTIFVEVPSILSSPGSIFIEASAVPPALLISKYAALTNNTLLARAGSAISIFNKTAFPMISEGAFIDRNQRVTFDKAGNYLLLEPGNVYVNNTALNAPAANGNLGIEIIQDALGTMGEFGLTGLAIPLAASNLDQDLYINGDVINENGAVKIKNLEGSIFVNGEIRGATVEIFAARDFNLNTEGWFHTNRDPQQYLDFAQLEAELQSEAEKLRDQLNNSWINLPTATTFDNPEDLTLSDLTLADAIQQDQAKILAQGDILITARFLNVNGLIQSGSDLIEFFVESNFVAPLQNTHFTNEKGTEPIPGISYGDAGVPIDGYWDAGREAFVLEKIKPEGGKIQLVGQVLSTGNGRLQVANGFPSVNIDNNSPYKIIFEGIDTSSPREGLIEITDTSSTDPLVRTQYKFNSATNQIGKTIFHGTEAANGGITYQQIGSTIFYAMDANLQYETTPGRQYVWTRGQRSTEQKIITYIKDQSWYTNLLFFIEFDRTDVSGVQVIPLDDEPTAVSEVIQSTSGQYFESTAYSLKYIRTGNPAVELLTDVTLVRHPPFQADLLALPPVFGLQPGTAIYRYVGPNQENVALEDEDYSNLARWVVEPATSQEIWAFDRTAPNQFDSDYRNYKVTLDGPHKIDGGDKLQLKKFVEQGKKDLYTHSLRADYPIAIQFSHSPLSPQIKIESKGGVLFIGNVKSPDNGAITITSTTGSVETDGSVAIFGASPTVYAGKDIKLNIEGNKGPLSLLAGGSIELNAVSQDNASSSFVVNSIASINGDVLINAKDGIIAAHAGAKVTGELIELLAATGEIGTDAQSLRVESNKHGEGGLTAYAQKDIFITQTDGDLILIRPRAFKSAASVESQIGDVTLVATNGSILDGDDEFIPKTSSPRSSLVQQFLNAGLLTGQWTPAALKYPVSAGMVKFLYPHATFLGQTPQTEVTERVNVRGKQITLAATASGKQIGDVGDAIIINEPNNFSALNDEQQSILANANLTDVVAVAYGLYRFLGGDEANVDLTLENFSDPARWLKLNTHFTTGLNRGAESFQLLQAGDRVRVEHDVDHYGVYEYTGPTETLNLLEINYLDRTRWVKLVGAAATDGGPANLHNAMLVTSKFVVDSLILRPIRDVNIDAQDWVRSTAAYRTALEEVDSLRIMRIESGDDVFLRARGDAVDIGERIEVAAIASAGEVVISALGNVTGLGETLTMRTQITPAGSLRILASGGTDITQVVDDTTLGGNPAPVNHLQVDRIDAGGPVEVKVQDGNLIINHITSQASIDLQAQHAILDAFPIHKGVYVNVHVAPSATPGGVTMQAQTIGSSLAPLTVEIESGDLITSSSSHQWLAAAGPVSVTSLVSLTGNISLQAEDEVAIGNIQAASGLVTIKAKGSLTDRDHDLAPDITAISMTLESTGGSIGTATNDLEINTANTTTSYLSAIAQGEVRLVETSGRLNVLRAESTGQGDVRLSTIDLAIPGQDIVAGPGSILAAADGSVVLSAGDNVTIDGTVTARHLGIYADLGQVDSEGAMVSISGVVAADSAEINTDAGADQVSITSTVTPGWTIRTGDGDDMILGSSGDDYIYGGAGVDWLRGGAGNDYLHAGTGVGDALFGEAGDDILVGSSDGDETDPNFFDSVRFGDLLDGGSGNDTIYGQGGADLIYGGDGDDTVHAGEGSDLVFGGAGNDTLYAGQGQVDEIHGDDGDDFIVGSNNGNDRLYGGAGNDRILGQAGMDMIDGGDGDDWIDGGADSDIIFGGTGNDELIGGGGGDLIRGGEGDDLIYGSDDAADQLLGEGGRDRIYGLGGNDSISGGTGDDILDGGAGDDIVEGDAGSDVILGGSGHDKLYANNAANFGSEPSVNYLYGDFGTGGNEPGSGNDQLYGAAGRDLLYGEGGDDLIDDDLSVPGIPQPAASQDFIHYGSDEGPDPTTFANPVPTPPPALLPPAPEYAVAASAFPSGPMDLGRWSEMAGSASGVGLGRMGITSKPAIASTATGAIAAWSDVHNGRSLIYVAQYDGANWKAVSAPTGSAVGELSGQASHPSLIVASNGRPTVAWTQRHNGLSQIQLAQFDPTAAGGQGAWLALGNSLNSTGLSDSGNADHAQLIETSFGLVVLWQENVAGTHQLYARRFNGNAWIALGPGSDSGGGITHASVDSQVVGASVAASSGRMAVSWSQLDASTGQRHVYLREYDGASWNSINGSANDSGISGAVTPGSIGPVSHDQPTLAYLGNELFVGWQQRQGNLSLVTVASIDLGSNQLSLVDQLPTFLGNASPKLAANATGMQLAWLAQPNRIYVRQWNGTEFVEAVPGEASGLGITTGGSSFTNLTLSRDSQGNSAIAWLDQSAGQPQLMLRRDANTSVGAIYTASANGPSIQQLLDTHALGTGDVILVDGTLNGDVTITAADSGVTIIGLPGSKLIGKVTIQGHDVTLQRLSIQGDVLATSANSTLLRENTLEGQIQIHGGVGSQLMHNVLSSSGSAIVLSGAASLPIIRHNTILQAVDAISMGDPMGLLPGGTTDAIILANRIVSSGTGIRIRVASSAQIVDNYVSASATAFDLDAPLAGSVERNQFRDAAIGVRYEYPANLGDNTITSNQVGVLVTVNSTMEGLGYLSSAPNRITQNEIGVQLNGRMQNQHIMGNVIGITGSSDLVSDSMQYANVIENNQLGTNVTGAIAYQRFNNNQVAIKAADMQSISQSIFNGNSLGVDIVGRNQITLQYNTFFAAVGTHIQLSGGAQAVHVYHNVLWTGDGYDLYVDNDSTVGFDSDHNLWHSSGNGKLIFWTKDFDDLLDWQEDVARFDFNSIGRTAVNPEWSEPRFANRSQGDFRLIDQVARQRLTNPAIGKGAMAAPTSQAEQAAHLVLISPDLYEDWHRDVALPIRWNSFGNVNGSRIRIDLLAESPTGPVFLTNIAANAPDTGEYLWRAADQLISYGTTGLRIQISWVDNATVLSRSTETFAIPNLTSNYFVNDQSEVGDQFTTAKGNNRYTGTTPGDPKPYANNVLRNYTLASGERVFVDAGNYALLQPLRISPIVGLGDDSAMEIIGSSGGPTRFTPANPLLAEPLVHIQGASNVGIYDLALSSGHVGVQVDTTSSSIELNGLTIEASTLDGIVVEAGSTVDLIANSVISGNGRHGIYAEGRVDQVQYSNIHGNAGTGLILLDANEAAVTGNVLHGNQTGVDVQGTAQVIENRVYNHSGIGMKVKDASLARNVVYSNAVGVQSAGSQLNNNLVYANAQVAIELTGSVPTQLINNTLHQTDGTVVEMVEGSDHTLLNNILWADGGQAIDASSAAFAGVKSNYNDYHLTGGARMALWNGDAITSLANFQGNSGTDSNSYTFNPHFVNPVGADGVLGYVDPNNDGRDDDFHLKSTAGSFHGGALAPVATNNGQGLPSTISGTWTMDAVGSLAIDAGNPNSSFVNEPVHNGNRINLGAYGNTAQASKTAVPYLYVLSPNGGEVWSTGATLNLLWNSDDLNSGTSYRIELYKAGVLVLTIDAAAPDNGSYAWTVPSFLVSGSDYSIQVRRAGGSLIDESDAPFSIVNTNQAPALNGTFNFDSIEEDNITSYGNLVADMLAGRLSDPDGPAVGVAIAAVDNTNGTWEYALDGLNFSSLASQLGGGRLLLLAADATTRIRFVPHADFFGMAGGVTYFAWDQADATLAGSAVLPSTLQVNSLSTQSSVSSIHVTAINDAPTDIELSNNSVKEKLAVGTVVGVFGTVDIDSAEPFTYELVSGAGATDNIRFTIVGNELRLAQVLDYETKPTHSIRVKTTDSQGASFEKIFSVDVLNTPVKVTGIYVRGSGWSSSYLAMLAANNLGSTTGGFRLIDGPNQLANSSIITWQNIDQVSITFDEHAVIDPQALRLLNGTNQDLALASGGYTYDSVTRTARWTLNEALTPGKFLISLESLMIHDGVLGYLDGEWTTSNATYDRHGDDNAGGDLNFLFHYLPGDISRNGQTNPGDVNLLRSVGTLTPDATNYWYDVTGNNQINPGDVNLVRSLGTLFLSGAEPTVPPAPRGGSPLTSASGYYDRTRGSSSGEVLTAASLELVRQQALTLWAAAGLSSVQFQELQQTPIVVGNFSVSPYLGMSFSDRIEIDDDAAGWGWLIEGQELPVSACPEIKQPGRNRVEDAQSMDLLSVVLHEMGHQLGLVDLHDDSAKNSLMFWRLSPGEVRRPEVQQVTDQSLLEVIEDIVL